MRIAGRGEQSRRVVSPEAAFFTEERLLRVDSPADDVAAHALEHRVPGGVTSHVPCVVASAELVLEPDEIRRESARLVVGIVVPFAQSDAHGLTTRPAPEELRGHLDEVRCAGALVHEAEELDRGLALLACVRGPSDVMEYEHDTADRALLVHDRRRAVRDRDRSPVASNQGSVVRQRYDSALAEHAGHDIFGWRSGLLVDDLEDPPHRLV